MKRDMLKTLEEQMPTFSKGQKQIARFIIDHYDKAAYMTASKMGAEVGISESTVVRFVMELGYEGYAEFQKSLQEIIRTKLTAFQRVEVTNSRMGDGDILKNVLMSDIDKIRRTLEYIDPVSFNNAVDRIVTARNIYIIGVRSSSSLAGFLNYNFRMMFDNVKFVQTTSGSEMFEQIMNIGKDDVMIAISFPRYSKRIIHAVEYARGTGADVISLTDSPESPIALHASYLLVAQSDMVSFVDSLVAPLSVINALIVAVSRKRQDEFAERLRKLEVIWDKYDVYDKTQN
ncbi:sIS domain protein [Clostridium sp. CAG:448]|nr:sIS domain protein [Clostridium sp. CAG:448]